MIANARITALLLVVLFIIPALAGAHCDTMDGPVVEAGRQALRTGQVERVLIWVKPDNEAELRAAFASASKAHQAGTATDSSDRVFFETLVRIHREGEGAAYTGLKPAGTQVDPILPVVDQAVENGSSAGLMQTLHAALEHQLAARFDNLQQQSGYATEDVAAGRAYVESYVQLLHYVEQLHTSLKGAHPHGE